MSDIALLLADVRERHYATTKYDPKHPESPDCEVCISAWPCAAMELADAYEALRDHWRREVERAVARLNGWQPSTAGVTIERVRDDLARLLEGR